MQPAININFNQLVNAQATVSPQKDKEMEVDVFDMSENKKSSVASADFPQNTVIANERQQITEKRLFMAMFGKRMRKNAD